MSDHANGQAAPQASAKHAAGLVAEFAGTEELLHAARRVRDAGYRLWDAHSPFPIHGMEKAMGIRRTILPFLVFLGGAAGAAAGLLLEWYTNAVDYPFLVSDKPYFSLPANIPIVFETTVLFAALTAVFGMLLLNRLPQPYHPVFSSPRFRSVCTNSGFFISIDAKDPLFRPAETQALLREAGAGTIETLEQEGLSVPAVIRNLAVPALLLVGAFALIPPVMLWRSHVMAKDVPRFQFVPDMDQQARFDAQEANPMFRDGRAMRPPVAGTVARGRAVRQLDRHLYGGIQDGTWAADIPVELTSRVLGRGRERFDIYCAPCHGLDGDGSGPVSVRAAQLMEPTWIPPLSLHSDAVVERANGHLFNTITHGIRTMPPYGDQIAAEDRWAIVAYVRALQRAWHARIEDVPPEQRGALR